MISRYDVLSLMVKYGPFTTKTGEYNFEAFVALINAAIELESKQCDHQQ